MSLLHQLHVLFVLSVCGHLRLFFFFWGVSATVKLVHFSKVKHRSSAHPDQDRQGKWLKNLIKNSKLHHYHAYHRPLPGEQLIKHPKFMTSSPWDSTPPSPLMGLLLKGKAPGWKERTGCLLNGGYRAGRWGAEDGWESVWGSTEAEKTKDLGNKEEMWLGWGKSFTFYRLISSFHRCRKHGTAVGTF